MPIGVTRDKVVYGLGAARRHMHRYTRIRWVVGILFTVGIALLPLTGVLRLDLWGGHNVVLGEEVGPVEAAKAFAFPFLAVNIGIILLSRFVGRYLCGFVCPIGSLARLSEWFRWKERKRHTRWAGAVALFLVSVLLAAVTFSFWVDWGVFVLGSPLAKGLSAAFLAGTTLVIFGTVHGLGLRFCRHWCPSGVYFAVLGPVTHNGVQFAAPQNCTDCKACEKACPMDLEPTMMMHAPVRGGSGFYPDGLSNHAMCIRCGDCVAACEGTTAPYEGETPLRMGWFDEQREREKAS